MPVQLSRTHFLVGAFLEKRVDYSHGFSSVLFLRPPELTKIVLPKFLPSFKFHLSAQGPETKSFPHNIQCQTRQKGPQNFFPQRVPPSICLGFPTDWVLKNSKGSPLSICFGVVRFFFRNFFSAVQENTLKL